jgi:hypothetical protein
MPRQAYSEKPRRLLSFGFGPPWRVWRGSAGPCTSPGPRARQTHANRSGNVHLGAVFEQSIANACRHRPGIEPSSHRAIGPPPGHQAIEPSSHRPRASSHRPSAHRPGGHRAIGPGPRASSHRPTARGASSHQAIGPGHRPRASSHRPSAHRPGHRPRPGHRAIEPSSHRPTARAGSGREGTGTGTGWSSGSEGRGWVQVGGGPKGAGAEGVAFKLRGGCKYR